MATTKTSISLSPKVAAEMDAHWQEYGYSNRNDFITTAILVQMERDKNAKSKEV